jgi:hypothetical protein
MQLVMTAQDPCWVRLHGATDRFLATVRAGVRPRNRRRFVEGYWEVHWHWLPQVIGWARLHYEHVDWSQLPTEWQLRAAGAAIPNGGSFRDEDEESPFSALYVTEEAPPEVVTAAYRALAKIHHPDAGGDGRAFQKIADAYARIQALRQSTACG